MATTPTYINQRINNLQSQINGIISGGGVPTSSNLADVLLNGNSAGSTDIDMNHQDLTNVETITLNSTTTTFITNTLTNTQIQIIDNDPAYADPPTTTITSTSINVTAGVNELDTTINNQSIQVRLDNDHRLDLSSGSISILNDTLSSSLTDTTLSFNDNGFTPTISLSGSSLTIDSLGGGILNMGDVGQLTNGTTITINDGTPLIASNVIGVNNNYCNEFKITGLSTGNIFSFNDAGNDWTASLSGGNNITFTQGDGRFRVGDVGGVGNGMLIDLDYSTGFKVNTGTGGSITRYTIDPTGIQTWEGGMGFDNVNNVLSFGKPQFASNYSTSGGTLGANSPYSQTVNGTGQTLTLPVVTSTNVGTQYLITNTNASALTVNGSGGQFIYSSFGTAVALTKNLNQGHSHIFTAIYTTGVGTFGWSMV